jgi:hypothetical protein
MVKALRAFENAFPPKTLHNTKKNEKVCHNVALQLTLKSILRQKKNYENSNISPCKNIFFQKILYKKWKSFNLDIATL